MARIAVEDSLQDVKDALQNSGHTVVPMEEGNLANCQCCVISGLDKDVMGMAERAAKGSVINARGMTADEVVQQIDRHVSQVAT